MVFLAVCKDGIVTSTVNRLCFPLTPNTLFLAGVLLDLIDFLRVLLD